MKLRRSFLLHQLLFPPVFGLVLAVSSLHAQDEIVLKDGRTQAAKIVGVSGASLQIQVPAGVVGIPLAAVAQVKMPVPPEFALALKAYEDKDYSKALVLAKSISDKFRGLPTSWAQQATGMVGDIYVAINDIAKAEIAYRDFQASYPGQGGIQAEVGMARLDVSKKDFASAKKRLEPVITEALKQKVAPKSHELAYSQAFYLMGQINESEQQYSQALENYLRTVTLYYHDRVAANNAQERADALRKQQTGIAVP